MKVVFMKKTALFISLLFVAGILLGSGCKNNDKTEPPGKEETSRESMTEPAPVPEGTPPY
ncbi:MAG: hypothetical protein C4526_00905 [Nitrospiraceae bacterium]|nr:MAG: hypothetical protein C4526_00905 [Nitrospiraceae bacterium]